MKRTLLVTLEYPPFAGGVANYYSNLVEHLPSQDIAVLADNTQSVLLSQSRYVWPKWLRGLKAVYRQVKEENVEHLLVGQVLPVGTIAWLLKPITRVPYTVMTHALDVTLPFSADGSWRKRFLVKRILKSAQAVTTVSHFTKKYLERLGVPEDKITLIHPCPNITADDYPVRQTDIDALNVKYNLRNAPVLLTVGRLVERKGHDTVIDALPELLEKYPQLQYCIVGDGPERTALEAQVRRLNLTHHVTFVGHQTDAELAVWYTRADIFVMPARQLANNDVEGFGIVYLEAASFATPAVGGRSGGVPDAVVDEQTGVLVDPNSPEFVTEAVDDLLSNLTKRSQLGAAARRRVETDFDWELQAEKLAAVIDAL